MSDVEFSIAWRRKDPKLESDVRDYWTRVDVIPRQDLLDRRVSELCTLAYADGKVIAESTAEIAFLPGLKAKLAMLRASVDPQFRRRHLAVDLINHSKLVLEAWSAEHPGEEVMGVSAIFGAKELSHVQREPLGPRTNLVLVGYMPTGEQLRVAWFRHARI